MTTLSVDQCRPERRRKRYCAQFGIVPNDRKAGRLFTRTMMDQLDACKDDSARRLLLGMGGKMECEVAAIMKKYEEYAREWVKLFPADPGVTEMAQFALYCQKLRNKHAARCPQCKG